MTSAHFVTLMGGHTFHSTAKPTSRIEPSHLPGVGGLKLRRIGGETVDFFETFASAIRTAMDWMTVQTDGKVENCWASRNMTDQDSRSDCRDESCSRHGRMDRVRPKLAS